MINETDKAWLAGVLDVYGGVSKAYGRVSAGIRLQGGHPDVVSEVARLTLSNVTSIRPRTTIDRRGCAEHCPKPHVHQIIHSGERNGCYWTGTKALIIMENLRPYFKRDWSYLLDSLARVNLTAPRVPGIMIKMSSVGWDLQTVERMKREQATHH